jgi:hypothetical protein
VRIHDRSIPKFLNVVKEKGFLYMERLVPLDRVGETSSHLIRLRYTGEELSAMNHFIEIEFLPGSFPFVPYEADEYMTWPFVFPEGMGGTARI